MYDLKSQIVLKKIACLLVLFSFLMTMFVFAQSADEIKQQEEQTKHWASRIHTGGEKNNFSGTFVVVSSQEISSLKTVQAYMDGQTYELVIRLDGPPLEVYKVGHMLYTVYPENKFILLERDSLTQVFPVLLRFDHQGLERFYTIRAVGNERVVDRLTDVIEIEPKDQWRFRFKVWLDQVSGVLLRGQVFDHSGQLLIQITFSDIQIGLQPEELRNLKDYKNILQQQDYQLKELNANQESNVPLTEKGPWKSKEPVPGFKAIHHVKTLLLETSSELDQWIFTDGMVSVSVFIEPVSSDMTAQDPIYSVDGITHSLSLFKERYKITLVGEVPQETLKQFVQQLNLQ